MSWRKKGRHPRRRRAKRMTSYIGFSLLFTYVIPAFIMLAVVFLGIIIVSGGLGAESFILFLLLIAVGYIAAKFVSVIGYAALVLMRYTETHPSMGLNTYKLALGGVRKHWWELFKLTLYSDVNWLTSAEGVFYDVAVITPHIVIEGQNVRAASWRVEKYANQNLWASGDADSGIVRWHSTRPPMPYYMDDHETESKIALLLFPAYSNAYRKALYQDVTFPMENYLILFAWWFSFLLILFFRQWNLLVLVVPLGLPIIAFVKLRNIDTYLELFELCRASKPPADRLRDYRQYKRKDIVKKPSMVKVGSLSVDATPEAFACPSCKAEIDESFTKCPQCGETFQKTVIQEENVIICPQCDFPNPRDARQCRMCATKLVDNKAS